MPVKEARPSIEIEGKDAATLASSLLNLDIIDSDDGLARCELLLGNWGGPEKSGFQHFDRSQIEFGKIIKVKLANDTLFEGRISAINARFLDGGPPQIGVCAEDRLQDLRMARHTRCFAEATLGDVVQHIANEHGLQVQIDLNGPQHKVLAQMNQSDLAFLRDAARREDAQIWVENTILKVAARSRRNGGSVELVWPGGGVREFRVSADLAHQRTNLIATGWDVTSKQAARYEADEAAIRAELNDGDSGMATLLSAFGKRADTLAHGLPCNSSEARTLAEASLRHLARRFVVGQGIAETQIALRVGAKIKLSGLGPLFEGEYTLTFIHHRFDKSGMRTEFRCDRPSLGKGSA
ncbi:contractile injection system protein, VgrG/Pvc8 family [Nitrosomonas sp.]|uniref:phage late control D family protein n=1 Tax=Nitrosomonas sp. TaxID=42353 RepID=UPI0032EF8117